MLLCPKCKKPLSDDNQSPSILRAGLTYLSFEFFFWVLLTSLLFLGINVYLSGALALFGTFGSLYLLFWKNEDVPPAYCPSCDKTFDSETVLKAQRQF